MCVRDGDTDHPRCRGDYLSVARFAKSVLDGAPRDAETITADVPYSVWMTLANDGRVAEDTEPDLSALG